MDGDWEKIKNKKRIKKQDLDQREKWVKCWNEWITEAMRRERKSELKQMAGGKDLSGDVGNRYDNAGCAVDYPTFPPPYRPSDASPSCLYPSLQTELRALQMADLDLDSRPPPAAGQPAAGQPANLPASQPGQLASPLQYQPVSQPTHPPAVQADLTQHSGPSGVEGVIMHQPTDEQRPGSSKDNKIPFLSSPVSFHEFTWLRSGRQRGQDKKEEGEYQCPMLEVAGTNEPQLVFRPWTAADIQASAALLPDPVEDGRKFATEFKALCHEMRPTGTEIRRLLAAKIKPGDLVGLRLPDPAVRLGVTTGGENGDLNHRNGPWYNAIEHLCTDLITKFPQRSDCAVLQQVKQRPDETVADFLYRMEEAFNKHSGMERPADFTVLGPWEKMLCGYIMEGLLPEIAAQTKTLYVGWRHGVRFEELKRHALHSDDVINDRKKKKRTKERLICITLP
ncbi:uncharacterized protein LOC124870827 [Girardinichthys multiradiatus]|uniref:uncharacterized protein LOC124870827 n=1 Tax=Girardinichthys multiradiatus TaxID=208333 RepID=UPI001FAB9A70|nr:uncharacterized protein LOC124870827 [Girardinichthys multiradiatus]